MPQTRQFQELHAVSDTLQPLREEGGRQQQQPTTPINNKWQQQQVATTTRSDNNKKSVEEGRNGAQRLATAVVIYLSWTRTPGLSGVSFPDNLAIYRLPPTRLCMLSCSMYCGNPRLPKIKNISSFGMLSSGELHNARIISSTMMARLIDVGAVWWRSKLHRQAIASTGVSPVAGIVSIATIDVDWTYSCCSV
jgi:hypothetical protein